MTVRKTKLILLFEANGVRRAYESSAMLEADLDLCAQITGQRPECTMTEIALVLDNATPEVEIQEKSEASRKKAEYTPDFETFWNQWRTKRRKDRAYECYQAVARLMHAQGLDVQARLTEVAQGSSDGELAHIRLEALMQELENGVSAA